jgi:hypothetical protein
VSTDQVAHNSLIESEKSRAAMELNLLTIKAGKYFMMQKKMLGGSRK